MTELPTMSNSAKSLVRSLGLQNNRIISLSSQAVDQFPNLEVLDLSDQRTGRQCIYIDFRMETKSFKIMGNYIIEL